MDIKYASYVEYGRNLRLSSAMLGSFDLDTLSKAEREAYDNYQSGEEEYEDLGEEIADGKIIDLYAGVDLTGDDPPVHSKKGFNDVWSFEIRNVYDIYDDAYEAFWGEKYEMMKAIFR